MKSTLLMAALLATVVVCKAQDDLPTNDDRINFVPGLYLSFEDFIYNDPVDFEKIEGDLEEFFNNPMNSHKLTITRNDSVFQVEQAATWGYTDGKSVFLNQSLFKGMNIDMIGLKLRVEPWVKIHTIATLSFILFVTTVNTQRRNNFNQPNSMPVTASMESTLILNTKDGKFYKADLKELKNLIADDDELLQEFQSSRENRDVKFYTFLRRYNARHPLQLR